MAKRNAKKDQTMTEQPVVEQTAPATEAPAAEQPVVAAQTGINSITLQKGVVEKGGNIGYRQAGVRATVYFNKNIFINAGVEVPEELTITLPDGVNLFAQPGAVKPTVGAADRAAKAQELADKARQRAEAAKARAEKALAAAQKAMAKAGIAPAAEPVTE